MTRSSPGSEKSPSPRTQRREGSVNLLRRDLIRSSLSTALVLASFSSFAQTSKYSKFDAEMNEVAEDPGAVELTRQFREYAFRERGPTDEQLRAQPHLSPLYRSNLPISARAKSLLVFFEVSNPTVYSQRYGKPTWPGGNSGITIGVGYDIGYVTPQQLSLDWAGHLRQESIEALSPCCGVNGPSSGSLLAFVSDTQIPWLAASAQFDSFLPNVAGQTAHAFPNCETLSLDSFGALVSVVYNRGSAFGRPAQTGKDSRWEMRAIRDLMASGQHAEIPDQIRAMKRLWVGRADARGLLKRRDLEASLFEAGLA